MQLEPAPATLSLRVGDLDRERAEHLLQEAYCEGRLDEFELDQRLGAVMVAQTRRDLAGALAGLPTRVPAVAPFGAMPMVARRESDASALGSLAHFSALFSWIFGPLFVYSVATPGSPARREAANAFNFQMITAVVAVIVAVVGGALLPEGLVMVLMTIGWLGWLTLTCVGGARALAGQPWRNPVLQVLRVQALDPNRR